MSEIKSPLRYPGGKNLFVKIISQIIGDFDEYREPFIGGGSVFFHLKNLHPNKKFVVSDKFKDLYLFWKYAKEENEKLVSEIRKIKEQYSDGKLLWNEIKKRSKYCSNFQKAIDFFIINRISFSGVSYCGGYSEESFHKRFTNSSIDRVEVLSDFLQDVDIFKYDYSELLRMKPQKENSNVVIYCDPPYYIESNLYGKHGNLHSPFDHSRFLNMLKGCKFRFVISYNDCPWVREKFKFANIIDFNIYYPMRHGKQENKIGNELLITNFKIERNANDKI